MEIQFSQGYSSYGAVSRPRIQAYPGTLCTSYLALGSNEGQQFFTVELKVAARKSTSLTVF